VEGDLSRGGRCNERQWEQTVHASAGHIATVGTIRLEDWQADTGQRYKRNSL